jgi:hypothetical protein
MAAGLSFGRRGLGRHGLQAQASEYARDAGDGNDAPYPARRPRASSAASSKRDACLHPLITNNTVLGLVLLLELAVPWPAPSRAAFLPLCMFLGVALSVKALLVLACI